MVKIEELNEHIEKFGEATNKLNEISNICDDFDKTAKQVAEVCDKQDEIVENQEKHNTELKNWLDITLKTTESNLRDKMSLQESKLSSLETELNKTEHTLTEKIESQEKSIQELTTTIRTLKTLVIITLICSALAIGVTILMSLK